MDNTDIPSCPICFEKFDSGSQGRVPYGLSCGHSLCKLCMDNQRNVHNVHYSHDVRCPTCRTDTAYSIIKQNYCLKEVIGALEDRETQQKLKNPMKCMHCRQEKSESEMLACRNCIRDTFKFDVYDTKSSFHPTINVQSNIKKYSYCLKCSNIYHGSANHQSVLLFPIIVGFQFESHLTSINLLKNDVIIKASKFRELCDTIQSTIDNFHDEVNKVTEMVRTAKSTVAQDEIMNSIRTEFKNISNHLGNLSLSFLNKEKSYQVIFQKLVARNTKEKNEKCMKIPERIAEIACVECKTKHPPETMYCCPLCCQEVNELMKGTLDVQKSDGFCLEDKTICAGCIVKKHVKIGHHDILEYSELKGKSKELLKWKTIKKKMESWEQSIETTIANYKGYTDILNSKKDKITQMSYVVVGSRGTEDHMKTLTSLERDLDEARKDLKSNQINFVLQNEDKEEVAQEQEVEEDVPEKQQLHAEAHDKQHVQDNLSVQEQVE